MILVNGAVGTSLTPGSNAAARASDRSSRELDAPDIRHQLGLAAAPAALVAGLAYVAISAYWALGGTGSSPLSAPRWSRQIKAPPW